ncbi:aminotransferase class III-fold pyridoxal phosphate-dependent enzyme [archaeon]|nr:MAG: aminotransferase class III-fold pyridoxal phosphate-dependent enzyme [archaeon]
MLLCALYRLIYLCLYSRYEHVAKCQEYYFRHPPIIERGYRTFMYDIHGRAYLDMVNNVAIVGHCHEHVNQAISKQAKLLNTNSRFIYSALSVFAEEILSNIPKRLREQKKLNKVFFVNSGSEATDLALRIARVVASERRAWKKGLAYAPSLDRDVVCIQGGYHGITTASDEVSTTLNDNPRLVLHVLYIVFDFLCLKF